MSKESICLPARDEHHSHVLRIAFLLIASSLWLAAQETNMNDLSAGTALGGAQILATIRNAETVTAQRVDSIPAEERKADTSHPQIVTLGEPFPVGSEDAAALKAIFCQGATYLSPSKSCEFRANVRYGFLSGQDKVEIILCFGCGEMEVWHEGKLASFGPFDGGYGGLLTLTKRQFPDDRFFDKFSEEVFRQRASRMKTDSPTPRP